jgi:hypothetical protein
MALTPEQRTMCARIGANARWAKETASLNAARGQDGLLQKFVRDVDPNGTLPEEERYRRAECAHNAQMLRPALASSKASGACSGSRRSGGRRNLGRRC